MKLGNILNPERVKIMGAEPNAFVLKSSNMNNVKGQSAEKVIFPEPYENASHYYNKQQFNPPKQESCEHNTKPPNNNMPMFDIKSILPMLMSGKFNNILTPLMSLFGGGNGVGSGLDVAKIFEMFKPKSKSKSEEKKEDISSKFDDMIIIED